MHKYTALIQKRFAVIYAFFSFFVSEGKRKIRIGFYTRQPFAATSIILSSKAVTAYCKIVINRSLHCVRQFAYCNLSAFCDEKEFITEFEFQPLDDLLRLDQSAVLLDYGVSDNLHNTSIQ